MTRCCWQDCFQVSLDGSFTLIAYCSRWEEYACDQNSNINLEGLLKRCSQGSCGNKTALCCLLKTCFSCHPVQPPSRVWNVTWWRSIPTVSLGKHYFVETIWRVHRNWNNTKENKNKDRRLIYLSEQQCRLSDTLIQLVHSNVFLW